MKKKKNGKQFKLAGFNKYKVTYGTVDKTNTQTMYIQYNSWAEPKIESDVDYNKVLRHTKKKIKDWLFNNINTELFEKDFSIVDLDLRVSGIQYNKKSFMSCELTLFKKTEDEISSDIISDNINLIINGIATNVLDKSEYFTFHKTKTPIKKVKS